MTDNSQKVADTVDVKSQLADILTSDDYSIRNEYRMVKPQEQGDSALPQWLENAINWLFDHLFYNNGSSSDAVQWGSVLLKALVIIALLLFIVWLVKNRHILNNIRLPLLPKSSKVLLNNYNQTLVQDWHGLPPHDKVAEVVIKLINQHKVIEALSILYRASLRWLNDNELLFISPANTELQCLQQIEQIEDSQLFDSGNYIIQIIQQWLPIAYHNSPHYDKQALQQLAEQWDEKLPLTISISKTDKGEL